MNHLIRDIEMSDRLQEGLMKYGIVYLEELYSYTDADYFRIKYIGRKSIHEAQQLVEKYKSEGKGKVSKEKNEKLIEMQKIFSARYNSEFTLEEVQQHCVAIVHDGLMNKNWSLNGLKAEEVLNKEIP